MSLSLVTAPALEPITMADAKLHCKVDTTLEEPLFGPWITAARQYAETFTHRALLTQTWDLKLDRFPCGAIELPCPPVQSVTSVTYLDTAGASQTWSSSLYETDLPAGPQAMPGRLQPVYGEVYPLTREVFNAVTVRVVCGYGAAPSSVPALLREALLMLVARMYEKREARIVEGEVSTADALLWQYKVP